MKSIIVFVLISTATMLGQTATCESNSKTVPLQSISAADSLEHIGFDNGSHSVNFQHPAVRCNYYHVKYQANCNTSCTVFNLTAIPTDPLAGILRNDSGAISVPDSMHLTSASINSPPSGSPTGIGQGISCSVPITAETDRYPLSDPTNTTKVWGTSFNAVADCPVMPDPAYTGGGGGGCTPNPNSTIPISQGPGTGSIMTRVQDPGYTPPPCTISPIIIDTEGEGFHLTSSEDGVTFDMQGTGHPIKLSWTAKGSHNAFLALDRDGSGSITSGKELFGDWTAQPRSPNPNGFLALAEFDKPENGGNGDSVIDERDAVFPQLRLWIDLNHDGVAQRDEIHTLPDLGVYSLALHYVETRKTDRFGNQFRYRGRINMEGDRRDKRDEVGRFIYDVFFVIAP